MPNADWYARFGYPCILHICATMYAECSIGDLRLAPSARHLFEDVIKTQPRYISFANYNRTRPICNGCGWWFWLSANLAGPELLHLWQPDCCAGIPG